MMTFKAVRVRPFTALASAALFTSLASAGALAHVTLATSETAANSSYRAVLRVPHGCDGEATTAVRVQIPEGVIAVKPMPKPGWTLSMKRGPYAAPYQNHGRAVSEGVKEIVWSGGSLLDEHFDEFTFQAFVATDGGTARAVYFPTVQSCTRGEAAWTEIPAANQSSRGLKKPAPSLRISAAMVAQAAGSASFKAADITVAGPWTRATPGGAKVAGGYLKITNSGPTADRLTGGSTDIAGRVEIHEMTMSGGVMRMRPLNSGLEVKAGQTVELTPGGYHVMFMDLKRPLKQGETVKATLQFEKAGAMEVVFSVSAVGGSSAPKGGGHHHHH